MKKILYLCLLTTAFILSEAASAQSGLNKNFKYADSLFLAKDYVRSGDIYKSLITDTSHDALHLNRLAYTELMSKNYKAAEAHLKRALASNPSAPLKASILSRMARISASQNNATKAVVFLDSAVTYGYLSFPSWIRWMISARSGIMQPLLRCETNCIILFIPVIRINAPANSISGSETGMYLSPGPIHTQDIVLYSRYPEVAPFLRTGSPPSAKERV